MPNDGAPPPGRTNDKSAQDFISRYREDFGTADEPMETVHAGMWHVIALARLILGELETMLAETGIGPFDLFVMAVLLIEREGNLRPSDVARILSVTPAAISLRLAKLEAGGFLERRTDGADRRSVRMRLTGKGEALTRTLLVRAGTEAQFSRALARLDPERRESLEQTLAQLYREVDRHAVR